MKIKSILFLIAVVAPMIAIYGDSQIKIDRIEKMPNLPQPYQMRDWHQVAIDYDALVYDLEAEGTYFPLVGLNQNGNNYIGDKQIWMKTFVGTHKPAEAINILPSIVGASLVGIDKSNQGGINWVDLSKDFFNKKNGQDVYLNNYSAKSGHDWWYDLMPNVYFYQLYSLYPSTITEHASQFDRVADRWLGAVYQLGGNSFPWAVPNMNHRAFNLETGKPLVGGVKEPESAGSIAWLLYQAYCQTGDTKYFEGAQLSMDFLEKWTENPSYELQLPYGVLAATRMNAEQDCNYNVEKMMNWCFDKGKLRQWGCIVGNWSGYDVSGLIGEAKDDKNDYAFLMNGFQHAAALAPIAKYDVRYARALGKWLLNLANASHLMYRTGLPQERQQPDSYAWSLEHDPNACMPYEAMKENWEGKGIRAMGDAFRNGWSETDMSLYTGSSVGYLGAVVDLTSEEGILEIDLNKTDFFVNSYPSYLYYNPYDQLKEIVIELPSGEWNIYSPILHKIIAKNQIDTTTVTLTADAAEVIVIYPSENNAEQKGNKLYAGDTVIDYYYEGYEKRKLRIKNFYSTKETVLYGEFIELYCLVDNVPEGEKVSYEWYIDGELQTCKDAYMNWSSPSFRTDVVFKVICSTTTQRIEASKKIEVYNNIYPLPEISTIRFDQLNPVMAGSVIEAEVEFVNENPYGDIVWTCERGQILEGENSKKCQWKVPHEDGVYDITVVVSKDGDRKAMSQSILVKNQEVQYEHPLIYLPFNDNIENKANTIYEAKSSKQAFVVDAKGRASSAFLFDQDNSMIWVDNDDALNSKDAVALSFWISPSKLGDKEAFIVSHGSWEERYKVSIIPEKKLRWTVKTDVGIRDLDSKNTLEIGKYYHCVAQYTGYSTELYIDGELQSYVPLTGALGASSYDLTLSQKDETNTEYEYRGCIDEFRLYDIALDTDVIVELGKVWDLPLRLPDDMVYENISIYQCEYGKIRITSENNIDNIRVYSLGGVTEYSSYIADRATEVTIDLSHCTDGMYIVHVVDCTGKGLYRKVVKSNG